MKDLAATCKYTLIGKFSNTMPKVELIRNNFILQTQLSGGVKIAYFNSRYVYIDLDNELDYNMVWTKQRMSIAGQTRGSQARVKVQVDLTEKRPPYIWMGYVGEDITDGRWQKIKYDNIPDYCLYYKHQGHLESDCTIRQRDEDKKKKELENVRNKHTKDKDNNPQQSKGYKESEQKEDNNQHYKQQRDQEHMQYPQDDQWQTQMRRNNNQAETPRDNTSQADQSTKQAGIINIPTQNTYINLDMQESSPNLEVLEKYKGIKGDSRPQTATAQGQVQDEYNRKSANTEQDNINRPVPEDKSSAQIPQIITRQEVSIGQAVTGIDLMLPTPNPITNIDIIVEVAVGGLDGKGQETPTNLQEGVSKGRGELTHARNEDVDSDPSRDYRAPATPINNQQQTVTHQVGKDNNGKKVKVTPDDYGVLNSEDDLDPDNQSMDDSNEDAEDTMTHTNQVVGSTFRDKYSDVRRMTEQQGLSPRRRKQTRHQPNHPVTSMSDNSSRPMTRSKSKGLIIKVICWNARSINTKGSLERLQTLKKLHQLSIIAILEPFANNSYIGTVRSQLQMDHAVSNDNGKIWLFLANEVTGSIMETHDQHITITFHHTNMSEKFMTSFIYAKCKEYMRRSLWDRLMFYANMELPWCTIGDFNVITSIEETLGVIPYNMNNSFEFIGVIEACGLTNLGYTGLPFTWCNQRDVEARVWKRLDSLWLMINVQQCWEKGVNGNPMWRLHQKMKRITATLSNWSKKEYGDIFTKVKEFGESIRQSEEELMTNNNEDSRQKLHRMNAKYIRYLKMEESILKQKTQFQWFKEGDANTKYFHALMRGRRKRLFLHKIRNDNEEWIQGEEQIAQAAFTPVQNEMLQAIPTMEELRQVVFSMNPNSAAGPDGIGGRFYQVCWSIIKEDLLAAGRDQNKRKYHWASLDTMSLPYTEGGVGIRRLADICTSLQYKQWWNFRSKVSLWSQFLKAKCCQRAHSVAKKVDTGDSLMWRYMMKNKLQVEENIGWKIQSESCSFWWDDWLGKGPLYQALINATIAHFLVNGKWNERKLRQQVSPLLIPSILNTNFQFVQGVKDIAVWRLTEAGEFTCKSALEMCRKKKANAILNSQIWHRHIPFKMSFLLWRAIRYKLPTNESLVNFGVEPVKCYCCLQQGWDGVEHIFLQGHFAGHIWKFFAGNMGLQL
ncbi:hypothetical protein KY290_012242 [Solanum tuberosum]|uniref:Reverse transcriptase zinc-binding domain-containing protein n=1 Tax=Solanum tuberosum TaxID=4113 RepID=A0ABQ7W2Z7_SOLTU|nr:hypothetical protein KY290_012242 [Solanum tuberosum]